MRTFVTVGNALQPFERLLKAVCECFELLEKPVVVQHGNTPVRGISNNSEIVFKDFFPRQQFRETIAKSKLIISHGGEGTIIQALAAGKPIVVMPRLKRYGEMVDDHQLELCREFDRQGRLVMAMEPEDLPGAIARALQLAAKRRKEPVSGKALDTIAGLLRRYARQFDGHK